jgi:hypothetical protein
MILRINIISFVKTLFSQLWLSVSSVNFYQNVYQSYKGYGIKYVFTLSLFSSLIYCVFFLNYIVTFKEYFVHNIISKDTETFEYIMQQLPELVYDGASIKTEAETPIYLKDKSNNVLAVLDPNNQLAHVDKEKVPIIFTSSNILIFFLEANDKKRISIPIEYFRIFGVDAKILNETTLKKHFANIFTNAPTIFIYILTPLVVLKRFIGILLDKSLTIVLVYLVTNLLGPRTNMKTCARLVLFASGATTLIQPLVWMILPEFEILVFILQMWTNFLLFFGIVRIRSQKSSI